MNVNKNNLLAMVFAVFTMSISAYAAESNTTPLSETAFNDNDKIVVAETRMIGGEEREVDEDGFPIPQQKKKLGTAPPTPEDAMTPLARVKASPVGTLHNPYRRNLKEMAVWGKKRYMGNSCNGCHGGTGGGGMCPPISNSTWVYGYDDDTLFRLITLGSDELQKQLKISRKGRENVVGPMPPFGEIIKTDDEIWRIISYLRTIYKGDPKYDARNVH